MLKQRYLEPLLRNEVVSAFSMTEPQGGADPTQFETRAERDGDEWVINGEKWFTSHANFSAFLIVLAVTDPEESAHRRMSMFIVPADTPGVNTLRNVSMYGHTDGGCHSYIRYEDVRIPATTCSAIAVRASSSRRRGSAAAASITRCALLDWCGGRWT